MVREVAPGRMRTNPRLLEKERERERKVCVCVEGREGEVSGCLFHMGTQELREDDVLTLGSGDSTLFVSVVFVRVVDERFAPEGRLGRNPVLTPPLALVWIFYRGPVTDRS